MMEEILVNALDLSAVCRLCLSTRVTTLNIFAFSTRLMDQVADVIMKCAPVQITRFDDMPNIICQSCYTQLEKSHQFQKQVVKSDKTLRCYLQQLQTSNKQIKSEYSIQEPSENPLIHTTYTDITVKCESSKYQYMSDINVELKEEMPSNYTSAYVLHDETDLKSEIKEEIDDNSSITTECTVKLIDTLSAGDDGTEKKLKNSEIEEQSDNFTRLPPAVCGEYLDNREDGNKNSSESHKHKKLNKIGYKCEFCNKHFAFLSKFNIHKRGHTGEKPYQCDVCKKCFSVSGVLMKHQRVHTGEKPYQCDVCNKCFSFSHDLVTHQRIHTGEKPYQCDVCNKSFSQSGTLRTHQRIHTGEKSYKCGVCNVCNKRFSDARNLAKHRRVHTGEKPYQCDVCNKRFSSSQNLMRHQRVHTGEKPYQCDVCNKSFSQSSTWRAHQRVHTSEKPYQCDVCNKCFSESDKLITHQRKHTAEQSYQCGVCDNYFNDTGALIKHQCVHAGESL